MGSIKTPGDYYRSMERLMQENAHQVFVIEDMRALHNEAREHGIEFMVGGEPKENLRCPVCDEPGKNRSPIGKYKMECSNHHEWDSRVVSGHSGGPGQGTQDCKIDIVKSDGEPLLILEKGAKDEEVFPHKYKSRDRSPSGNWVYTYAEDATGPRYTGFEGEAAKKNPAAPPAQNAVRKDKVDGPKGLKSNPEGQENWFQHYFQARLDVPESTQKVVGEAVKLVGMEQFQSFVNNVKARHPNLKTPGDEAHLVETVAADVFSRHNPSNKSRDKVEGQDREHAERPGGFMPVNPALKKPWQMSKDEFEERKSINPSLGEGKSHRQHVEEAVASKQSVPWQAIKPYNDLAETYKDHKPALKLTPETEEYVAKFRELTADIPKSFLSWVKPEIRRDGDDYLTGKKASGYNIDQYDVADGGVYSHMMTAKDPLVLYHMYAQNKTHGEELLALLHENGINARYTVVKRASAVLWDENWGPIDKEMSERQLEKPITTKEGTMSKIAYSSDYIIAFKPRNSDEAKAIADAVVKNTSLSSNADKAIHHSYFVPDVRASQPVEGFEHAHLNVKRVGSQELCILTKNDWIRDDEREAAASPDEAKEQGDYDEGFERFDVYLNPEFKAFIKSLRVSLFKSQRFPGQFIFVNVEGLE